MKLVLVAAALLSAATPALADGVCVTIDVERDALGVDEREVARQVLERELEAAGITTGAPCAETWQLSHARLGASVHVAVVTPAGTFTASSPSLEALPDAYQVVVWKARAPRQPTPPSATEAVVAEPPPAPAAPGFRGAFYVRVGFGVAPGLSSDRRDLVGPTIGVGYRRSFESWLFDLSVMNLHAWRESNEFGSGSDVTFASFGRLAAYRVQERGGGAFYGGGGVSFGQPKVQLTSSGGYGQSDDALGLQVEGAVGYELRRNKAVRIFFEAWVTLPLVRTETSIYEPSGQTREERYWAPFLGASTGFGF